MWQRLRPSISLAGFAAGGALALFVGGAAASAQPTSTPACALGSCTGTVKPLSPQELTADLYRDSIRASRAARHEVMFSTGRDIYSDMGAAYAAAATETGDAIVEVAARHGGASALAGVTEVVIERGDQPSARLSDGRLTIIIVPANGAAGLPSTLQIEQILTP